MLCFKNKVIKTKMTHLEPIPRSPSEFEQPISLPESVPLSETPIKRRLGKLSLGRNLLKFRKQPREFDGERPLETRETLKPGEWVKEAPSFLKQCEDPTRIDLITYKSGISHALPSTMEGHSFELRSLTEHESLMGLRNFLKAASEMDSDLKDTARSMLETLTFIGKREYNEAVQAIAENWRQRLHSNPKAQLCILTGENEEGVVKSGEYLFDNVLQNFTDPELRQLKGRLVSSPDDLTASPEDVSVILLDDWTISGKQLAKAGRELVQNHPTYKDRLEVQLIAATEDTIKGGLPVLVSGNPGETLDYEYQTAPISAYYRAHDDPVHAPHSGAHITGAHCSVDYDFNTSLESIATVSNQDMPPASNIVRPYRQKGYRSTYIKKLLGRSWKRKQRLV